MFAKFPRTLVLLTLVFSSVATVPSLASAAPSGPRHDSSTVSCTVAGNVVNASGLPTAEVINFFITDTSGTVGWVLGTTSDGNWSVTVPARSGPTTYQFASRTWGPDGSKYTVYASCSA